MNIKQAIALNLSADGIPPRLHMVQGDSNTRAIVATLWDDAQPYTVPSGATLMLRFRKPDGTGGLYDTTEGGAAIAYSGSTVTIPVATQVLTVAGSVYAQLDIYGDGSAAKAQRLATFRCVIEVTPSVYPDAAIISSDYYNVLTADIAAAKTAATQAQASASAAAQSAASAATSVAGAVKYNAAQSLTAAQKQQAQRNIGITYPCSPNLLRNWYFGRPVNQRGVSGTVSTAGYFLDGWKLVSGSVTIGSDGITLNGTMTQVLEDTPVGTVTASALTAAGSITEVIPTYNSANKTLTVTASGKKLLAVKLELGDTQTLAHQDTGGNWVLNEIPDFGEQLSRCQRYLIKLESDLVPATIIGGTTILFSVPLPVTMRAAPTLVTNNFRVRATAGGTDQTGFTFSVSAIRSNGVQISAAKTSHGLTGASLNAGADGSLLSAEL